MRKKGTVSAGFADKAIDDLREAALVDGRAIFRDVEFEELPIVRDVVEALRLLDHDLGRHQLYDGADRVHAAVRRLGDFQGSREVTRQSPRRNRVPV